MSGGAELTETAGYPVRKRTSARYEGTFAYRTLNDRMPRILTQVIDILNREEMHIARIHGEAGTADVKEVISQLSELRYQLLTDKPMTPIAHGDDVKEWELVFNRYREKFKGENPKWYAVSWLFAECFMYRKIIEIIRASSFLKSFDPFAAQKKSSFTSSLQQITSIGNFLCGTLSSPDSPKKSLDTIRIEFEHLILISLWGNKMDLSMMASMDNYDTSQIDLSHKSQSPEAQTRLMRTNILSDHTSILWDLIQLLLRPKSSSQSHRVDIILDNCGLELFSDVSFADWLLNAGLADKVMFHFKQMPWFVSDAMISDFEWTLDKLTSSESEVLSKLGKRWKERVKDGSFVLSSHSFWTTSHEYASMSTVANDLYTTLSQSFLVIFKGDLNYRKLLADRNWLYTEEFCTALGGFEPTNVCALRTLKADLVTGLPPGAAERAASECKDWMVTGQYAVCQVNRKK